MHHSHHRSIGDARIVAGPLQIVRVPIGSCGLAYSEGIVQILLPGAGSRVCVLSF